MAKLPRVAVIGTGGTISSIGHDSLDVLNYSDTGKKLEADQLVARFPECALVADVLPIRYSAVPSPATKWVSSGTSRQISGPVPS